MPAGFFSMASSLKLSATELRQMTKWPDAVVLEFLSLQQQVGSIINNITNITNITGEGSTQLNLAQINNLNRALTALQEAQTAFDSLPARIAGVERNLERADADLSQSLQPLLGAVGGLRGKVASQGDALANLQQEFAGG